VIYKTDEKQVQLNVYNNVSPTSEHYAPDYPRNTPKMTRRLAARFSTVAQFTTVDTVEMTSQDHCSLSLLLAVMSTNVTNEPNRRLPKQTSPHTHVHQQTTDVACVTLTAQLYTLHTINTACVQTDREN